MQREFPEFFSFFPFLFSYQKKMNNFITFMIIKFLTHELKIFVICL